MKNFCKLRNKFRNSQSNGRGGGGIFVITVFGNHKHSHATKDDRVTSFNVQVV